MENLDLQSTLSQVSEQPAVGHLVSEFKRCGTQGDHYGRLTRTEDVRLSRWDGQSDDGKKHAEALGGDNKEVFPWEGASDVKVYQADAAVNENAAILYMAFWNSVLKIAGAQPNDVDDSATATTFLDWLVHFQLHRQLDVEVELSAQFLNATGATALHVTW